MRVRGFLLLLILLALSPGCNGGGQAVPEATPVPQPTLILVPEMEPFGEEFSNPVVSLSSDEVEAFGRAWESVRDSVAADGSSESLVAISRWAVAQMEGFTLPDGWIAQIPMAPVGVSADGGHILFGQDVEEGVVLPSDSPIVFRRLVVGVVYDRDSRSISQVYVSIRGWVEE